MIARSTRIMILSDYRALRARGLTKWQALLAVSRDYGVGVGVVANIVRTR